jgi:uncharacterized protein YjbI with pentapeptide repeats
VYDGVDFTTKLLARGQYEACSFVNCDFSNGDLSHIPFAECTFRGCNLSMVTMQNTTLNDVKFFDCKMMGINYEPCSEYLFTVAFDNCVLNFSSFYKRALKKTLFKNCIIREADFVDADCTGAVFDNCDLEGSKFENTNLEKADLRTAHGFIINPEKNRIKKARFELAGLPGLLARYDIVITP